MSCNECRGYASSCPCCEPEIEYETCERCNGTGRIFFCNDEETTKELYDLCPSHLRDEEDCEECGGEGQIEQEPYEPDPDEWYDRKREEDWE